MDKLANTCLCRSKRNIGGTLTLHHIHIGKTADKVNRNVGLMKRASKRFRAGYVCCDIGNLAEIGLSLQKPTTLWIARSDPHPRTGLEQCLHDIAANKAIAAKNGYQFLIHHHFDPRFLIIVPRKRQCPRGAQLTSANRPR